MGNDDTMKICEARTGRVLLTLLFSSTHGGRLSEKFSPNGKALISKNHYICAYIWVALDWRIIPNEHKEFKCQRYDDWLKANDTEVKKN